MIIRTGLNLGINIVISKWEILETKQFKLVRVRSLDGEIHYVIREFKIHERFTGDEGFDESVAKIKTKTEASKLLFLVRNE